MTQLTIDNVILPESKKGGYIVTETPLTKPLEMASGRIVKEVRGFVWEISYQYGYFDDELKNQVLDVCKRGTISPVSCAFLTPDGEQVIANFTVMSYSAPKFMWSNNEDGTPVPVWADFRVTLREVTPHD